MDEQGDEEEEGGEEDDYSEDCEGFLVISDTSVFWVRFCFWVSWRPERQFPWL